jgi:hypothetical protein
MANEDFKQCYDVLQRLGDRSQSIIYAFVLIYGALLLWSLNAIVYPSEQQRLGQILKKDAHIIKCLASFESKDTVDRACADTLNESSLDYLVKLDPAFEIAPGAKQFDLSKIDSDFILHELQYQRDRSSQVSQFNVPLFGVTSDRAWLWIVNITLGPLFYFLIRASLANVRFLETMLYERNKDQPVRLLLLSVTQVISSSPQKIDLRGKDSGAAGPMSATKFAVLCVIFTLPMIVSGLLLCDWFYFSIMVGSPEFRREPEFIGGILTVPVLLLEGWLWIHICILLSVLFETHNGIRRLLRSPVIGRAEGSS